MRRTRENDLEMKLSVMMTMSKGQIFRCLAIAKILRIIRFFPQIAWWYNFQVLSKQLSLQKISEQFTFGQEKLFELVDLLQKSHRNWPGAWTEINGFSSSKMVLFFIFFVAIMPNSCGCEALGKLTSDISMFFPEILSKSFWTEAENSLWCNALDYKMSQG